MTISRRRCCSLFTHLPICSGEKGTASRASGPTSYVVASTSDNSDAISVTYDFRAEGLWLGVWMPHWQLFPPNSPHDRVSGQKKGLVVEGNEIKSEKAMVELPEGDLIRSSATHARTRLIFCEKNETSHQI